MDIPKEKRCPSCGKVKTAEEFGLRSKKNIPYLASWCRECRTIAMNKRRHQEYAKRSGKLFRDLIRDGEERTAEYMAQIAEQGGDK